MIYSCDKSNFFSSELCFCKKILRIMTLVFSYSCDMINRRYLIGRVFIHFERSCGLRRILEGNKKAKFRS